MRRLHRMRSHGAMPARAATGWTPPPISSGSPHSRSRGAASCAAARSSARPRSCWVRAARWRSRRGLRRQASTSRPAPPTASTPSPCPRASAGTWWRAGATRSGPTGRPSTTRRAAPVRARRGPSATTMTAWRCLSTANAACSPSTTSTRTSRSCSRAAGRRRRRAPTTCASARRRTASPSSRSPGPAVLGGSSRIRPTTGASRPTRRWRSPGPRAATTC